MTKNKYHLSLKRKKELRIITDEDAGYTVAMQHASELLDFNCERERYLKASIQRVKNSTKWKPQRQLNRLKDGTN